MKFSTACAVLVSSWALFSRAYSGDAFGASAWIGSSIGSWAHVVVNVLAHGLFMLISVAVVVALQIYQTSRVPLIDARALRRSQLVGDTSRRV